MVLIRWEISSHIAPLHIKSPLILALIMTPLLACYNIIAIMMVMHICMLFEIIAVAGVSQIDAHSS